MKPFFQSWEFIFLITILVTITILAYAAFIYNAINRYNIKSLELLKNYEELKSTQDRMLLETEIEIREQTFQYISREIHDNITQSLSLANLILNCLDKNADDYKIQIDKCKKQLSKSLNDLNDLSKSLDSDIIESHGLVQALLFEIEKCKRLYSSEFIFSTEGSEIHLSPTKELFLLRIVQESLNNILKHANASKVVILIEYSEYDVKTTIKDNGIGFNPKNILQSKEAGKMAGLNNMRKRSEIIGGTFAIHSIPNMGTTLEVKIPYKNEQ